MAVFISVVDKRTNLPLKDYETKEFDHAYRAKPYLEELEKELWEKFPTKINTIRIRIKFVRPRINGRG